MNFTKRLSIFGVPFLMMGTMVILAKSTFFLANPDSLSIGITVDLLLTVPIVYFLLIRKSSIPKTTVIPLLILGMVVGYLILPPQQQYYLDLFKTWIFPLVEISIFSFVIYKVNQVVKGYKSTKNTSVDFYTALKDSCNEILPKGTVTLVVTEISVFYYGFWDWKKRTLKTNEFTYHKESGTISLLTAIMGIIVMETFVLHILLAKWSGVAAWILTFLSVYSLFQLFGFLKSIFKRPISIEQDTLYLRYGIMGEATIPISQIDSIEVSSKDLELDQVNRKLSFLGELESHNIILRLKEEHIVLGLYGRKRSYKNLAFHVDEKERFADELNVVMDSSPPSS